VSYQRIELWLGKARHEPVAADLYVQSTSWPSARASCWTRASVPTQVDEMLLQDELGGAAS
jgi:hypothetical protein